jgi:hypothetical protein
VYSIEPYSVARIVASWRLDEANAHFSSPETLRAGCKVTANVYGS